MQAGNRHIAECDFPRKNAIIASGFHGNARGLAEKVWMRFRDPRMEIPLPGSEWPGIQMHKIRLGVVPHAAGAHG